MQKLLVYFVVLFILISCNRKTDAPAPPKEETKKCRLVKMIQGTHNGAAPDTILQYTYDAGGKVTKVTEHYPALNITMEHQLSYDNTGRLTEVKSPNYSQMYVNYTNVFTYTNNGLLNTIATNTTSIPFNYRFEYATDSLPTKGFRYTYNNATKAWDTSEHRYTFQNGNMVSQEYYFKGVYISKSTYEYDTIPNLDHTLSLANLFNNLLLGWHEEFIYFNKNQLKKAVTPHWSCYMSYTLDSGRLTKSIYKWLEKAPFTDTTLIETRNFFYECQ
jgi:hypothetical protein